MTRIEVNGNSIYIKPTISIFKRTAYKISEDIYNAFEKIGIKPKFITLQLPRNPLKRDKHNCINNYKISA